MAGSRSRTDRYRVLERPVDEILDDLEMTDDEKKVARDQLRLSLDNARFLLDVLRDPTRTRWNDEIVHPGMTRQEAIAMIESLSISMSSNGIPTITFNPHPVFLGFAPDDRNWFSVEAPDIEQIRRFIQAVKDGLEKNRSTDIGIELSNDRDPIFVPDIDEQRQDYLGETVYQVLDERFGSDGANWYEEYRKEVQSLPGEQITKAILQESRTGTETVVNRVLSSIIDPLQGEVHDEIEHLSIGRGFDRHGEWAAYLVALYDTLDYIGESFDSDASVRSFLADHLAQRGGIELMRMQLRKALADLGPENYWDDATREQYNELKGMLVFLDDLIVDPTPIAIAFEENEFFDVIDPRDKDGKYINGSKSTTKKTSIFRADKDLLNEVAEESSNSYLHGSLSRTGKFPLALPVGGLGGGRESLFDEMELDRRQRDVAVDQIRADLDVLLKLRDLFDSDDLPEYMHPGMTRDEVRALLDSISLSIASNGVPMITFDPYPLTSDLIPGERDWSTVEALSVEQIKRLIEALDKSQMAEDWSESTRAIARKNKDEYTKITVQDPQALRDQSTSYLIEEALNDLGVPLNEISDLQRAYAESKGLDYDELISLITNSDSAISTLISTVLNPYGSLGILSSHDVMEHFGVGRGFDRHGEWAAFLSGMLHQDEAIKDFADELMIENEDVIDAVRKDILSNWLREQGDVQLIAQLDSHKVDTFLKYASRYDDSDRSERLRQIARDAVVAYLAGLAQNQKEEAYKFENLSKQDQDQLINQIVDLWENRNQRKIFGSMNRLPVMAASVIPVELLEKVFQDTPTPRPILGDRSFMELAVFRVGRIFDYVVDRAESIMKDDFPEFGTELDLDGVLSKRTIEAMADKIRNSSLTADQIIDLLDPKDDRGQPVNGSKSTTARSIDVVEMSSDEIESVAQETPSHHLPGSKSRTDRIRISEPDEDGKPRSLQQIAEDLELSPQEVRIASDAIEFSIERLQDVVAGLIPIATDGTLSENDVKDFLKAVTLSVASNGIPMIIGKPIPGIEKFIPIERDWSSIEAPTFATIQEIIKFIEDYEFKYLETSFSDRSPISKAILAASTVEKSWQRNLLDKILGEYASRTFADLTGKSVEKAMQDKRIFDADYDPSDWLDVYIDGLMNPFHFLFGSRLGEDIADDSQNDLLRNVDWHDFFGHFGIGRGFDRHGEWANFTAIDSILAQTNPPLIEDQQLRNIVRLTHFFGGGYVIILTQLNQDRELGRIDDETYFQIRDRFAEMLQAFANPIRFRDFDVDEMMRLIDEGEMNRVALQGSKSLTSGNRENLNDIDAVDDDLLAGLVSEAIRHDNRKNGIPDREPAGISGSKSRTSGEYMLLRDTYKLLRGDSGDKSPLKDTKWRGRQLTVAEIDEELQKDFPDFSGAILDLPNMALFDFRDSRRTGRRPMNFEKAFIGPDVRFVNIDLRGSNFSGAFLSSPRFMDADLSEVSFSGGYGSIKARNVNFVRAIFTGFRNIMHDEGDSSSTFVKSDMSEAMFDGADLHMSIIEPSGLTNAYFVKSRLRYLRIDGSDADKEIRQMAEDTSDEPTFMNFAETKLGVVDIRGINLSGSSFRKAETLFAETQKISQASDPAVSVLMEATRGPSSLNISVDTMIDVDFTGARLLFSQHGLSEIRARRAALLDFTNARLASLAIAINSTNIPERAFYASYGEFAGGEKELMYRAMGPSSIGINFDGAQLYNVAIGDQSESLERNQLTTVSVDDDTRIVIEPQIVRYLFSDGGGQTEEYPAPIIHATFSDEDFTTPRARILKNTLRENGAQFISGSRSTTRSASTYPPKDDGTSIAVYTKSDIIKRLQELLLADVKQIAARDRGLSSVDPYHKPTFSDEIARSLSVDAGGHRAMLSNRALEAEPFLSGLIDEYLSDPQQVIDELNLKNNSPDLSPVRVALEYVLTDTLRYGVNSRINSRINNSFSSDILYRIVEEIYGQENVLGTLKKLTGRTKEKNKIERRIRAALFTKAVVALFPSDSNLTDEHIEGILDSRVMQSLPGRDEHALNSATILESAKKLIASHKFSASQPKRPLVDEKLAVDIDDLKDDIDKLRSPEVEGALGEEGDRRTEWRDGAHDDGEKALAAVIEAGERIRARIESLVRERTSESDKNEAEKAKQELKKAKDEEVAYRQEMRNLEQRLLIEALTNIKQTLIGKNYPNPKTAEMVKKKLDEILKIIAKGEMSKLYSTMTVKGKSPAKNIRQIMNAILDDMKVVDIDEVDYSHLRDEFAQQIVDLISAGDLPDDESLRARITDLLDLHELRLINGDLDDAARFAFELQIMVSGGTSFESATARLRSIFSTPSWQHLPPNFINEVLRRYRQIEAVKKNKSNPDLENIIRERIVDSLLSMVRSGSVDAVGTRDIHITIKNSVKQGAIKYNASLPDMEGLDHDSLFLLHALLASDDWNKNRSYDKISWHVAGMALLPESTRIVFMKKFWDARGADVVPGRRSNKPKPQFLRMPFLERTTGELVERAESVEVTKDRESKAEISFNPGLLSGKITVSVHDGTNDDGSLRLRPLELGLDRTLREDLLRPQEKSYSDSYESELHAKANELRAAMAWARRDAVLDVLASNRENLGYSDRSLQGMFTKVIGGEGFTQEETREMIEQIGTIFPSEWIDALLRAFGGSGRKDLEWRKRGQWAEGWKNRLVLDPRGFTILVHELGHAVEDSVPGITAAEKLFFRFIAMKRGITDTNVKLGTYKTGEYYWPLNLKVRMIDESGQPQYHHYVSKIYPNDYYELLTMGLEALLVRGDDFDSYDRDYLNFLLGLLVGV